MKERENQNRVGNGTDSVAKSGIAESSGNREYKSDVFSMLLEDPVRALEVYNAINGTSYDDPSLVERIEVGERGISLSVRNDASFVLDASLSLYEHQSTICPNMPMRSLIYFSQIIRRLLKNRNVYGKTQIKIPVPYFVVFYNGTEPAEERCELRLSDAFERQTDEPQIELICKVYNINKGNNEELMEQCRTLREYMYFVDMVRQGYEGNGYEDLAGAITQAIDRCISEDVLADFYVVGNFDEIPYHIKALRAGSHCGGVELCRKATRRRRRISRARFLGTPIGGDKGDAVRLYI